MNTKNSDGFTYLEVLIAATLLAMTLLTMGQMFVVGYSNVNSSGKTTMGLSAARQLLEDVKRLPFDNIASLDGFDTDDPTSLPASGPEREIARRWRYALAGPGAGWSFTSDEVDRWTDLSIQGNDLEGVGTIQVAATTLTQNEVTVSISVPGRWRRIELSTRVAKL